MTGRVALKTWFVTGAKPTQAQFAEFINSFLNLEDDTIAIDQVTGLQTVLDAMQATLSGLAAGTVPDTIADATVVMYTKAGLNGAYPGALNGQYILCANINTKYLKLDNNPAGNWDVQPYNPVA